MSAQPNVVQRSLEDPILLRIQMGEALCAVAESLALAGRRREAHRCMNQVGKILDEVTRYAAGWGPPGDPAQELESALAALRHQARNVETVLKLLE